MKMYTILIRAYLSNHVINMKAPWNVYKIDTKVVYRNDLHYLYDKHEATKTTFAAMEFYKGHKTLQDVEVLRYTIHLLDGPRLTDAIKCYDFTPIQRTNEHPLTEIFEPTAEHIEAKRLTILHNQSKPTSIEPCGYDLNER